MLLGRPTLQYSRPTGYSYTLKPGIPSRYLNSGYPGNRGIFPKVAHARTINAMMHFLGFPERVVADDCRHKYEASGCGSHK